MALSLGDGFDLSGIEDAETITDSDSGYQRFESKRMQGMEQSLADISYSPVGNMNTGSGISGIFNISPHFNNNNNNNINSNAINTSNHMPPTTMAARKQLSPSATDSNEPAKPLSPYTLFFRDTVSAIKQQNPNCAFADLQRIVSSMWEALDSVQKENYNKKAETARNEYVKQLRIYRQQQSQNDVGGCQSPFTINNDASTNGSYTNNDMQDQMPQGQQTQSPVGISLSENQTTPTTTPTTTTTTPQITSNATVLDASPAFPVQETTTQPTQIAKDTATMEPCIRDGCNKRAIMNPDWEDEYCSNECVVIHCRNVFNDWVQQNKETASI